MMDNFSFFMDKKFYNWLYDIEYLVSIRIELLIKQSELRLLYSLSTELIFKDE